MLSILQSIRAEDPTEPFWSGVHRLAAVNDHVEIQWNEPVAPRLLEEGKVQVECHLYDKEALRRAEELRAPSAEVENA